jgi:cytochrome c biogenesis protein ResB
LLISGLQPDSSVYTGVFSLGKPAAIPGTSYNVTVKRYLADFMMDMEKKEYRSRSKEPNNPAVEVEIRRDTTTILNQWVFKNYPSGHGGKGPVQVEFTQYTPEFHTGLQIKYNPGVSLIWIGIILMTAGLAAMFYVSKRSVWVLVEPAGEGRSRIIIGGTADRLATRFNEEFESLCQYIKQKLAEGGT